MTDSGKNNSRIIRIDSSMERYARKPFRTEENEINLIEYEYYL